MDLSLIFCFAIVFDLVISRLLYKRSRTARVISMTVFFALHTFLIVGLVGSPFHPLIRPNDLPREFWLQLVNCFWWVLAGRELIAVFAWARALRRISEENKLISDIIAASVYVCSALAIMGFVFQLPLQGLVATSGILAIVLGLALQSTLSDVFSGISLSIEKPYQLGDEILLDSGAEGEVIQINWRSTHLRNAANDVVIVPNSAMAKMRIQNHSAGSNRHSLSLTVNVDSRNEPELTLEILKQAAMTCSAILEKPAPSAVAKEFMANHITYDIYFSTATIGTDGEARSQLIKQLYKRARPRSAQLDRTDESIFDDPRNPHPIYLFAENELIDRTSFLKPLSDGEKAHLKEKIVRRHYNSGDPIWIQGKPIDTVSFVFSGIIQITRQVQDGRVLNVRKYGPGDSFGEISVLTGMHAEAGLIALSSCLILEIKGEDLRPIITARPELVESLSHSAARLQQFLMMFDQAAVRPAMIEQRDIISRIRHFFHLNVDLTARIEEKGN
jgi:small-conductance mechanosensitive channel